MKEIKVYTKKLEEGCDLSSEEAEAALGEILSTAEDEEIGAFLLALKAKGEKPQEIVGFVKGMKKAGNTIRPNMPFRIVDTCGTGGDGLNTINVSTAAAIVTAAAGVPVAKHGNRAATSMTGSSDVLEALGIKVDLTPEQVRKTIEKNRYRLHVCPGFPPCNEKGCRCQEKTRGKDGFQYPWSPDKSGRGKRSSCGGF